MNHNIILRRMRRSPFFVVGFVLALSILLICFVSPLFVAYDAEKSSISERLLSPVGFVDGWSGHILGTDQLGRELWPGISAVWRIRSSCAPVMCS